MEKKVVSPFEFAIAEAIDPEYAKTIRPETLEEAREHITKNFKSIAKNLKIVTSPHNK